MLLSSRRAAYPNVVAAQEFAQATPAPGTSPAAGSGSDDSPNAGQGDQQNASKRNPQSSSEQPATPPQTSGLFGDFGHGDRTNLAKHGFTVTGHLVSENAGNITGGIPLGGTAVQRGTASANEFAFGFDADFGKIASNGAGILHMLVTTRFGANLASQALGNLVSVQEIYGDGQTTRFTYLDYEQPLFKNRLNIRLGKINQENDFGAGSTYWGGNLYCFYQNNNICGTPAAIPINNGVVPLGTEGYDYYPSSMWGVRVKETPNSRLLYRSGGAPSQCDRQYEAGRHVFRILRRFRYRICPWNSATRYAIKVALRPVTFALEVTSIRRTCRVTKIV